MWCWTGPDQTAGTSLLAVCVGLHELCILVGAALRLCPVPVAVFSCPAVDSLRVLWSYRGTLVFCGCRGYVVTCELVAVVALAGCGTALCPMPW
jgi:hypothetical protein